MQSTASQFHWDFMVFLSIAALVTGVVWALETWRFGPARRAAGGADKPRGVVEFCRSFFPVIVVVLILRALILEPFRIPSGSMIPTLNVGDFILVNKFTYGLRDPVFHQKLLPVGRDPQRGDVIVFRWPVDPSKDFIKRVVGIPGDQIVYRDKQLSINGVLIEQEASGSFSSTFGRVERFEEYLNDDRSRPHQIIITNDRRGQTFEFTVPDGEYFVMGDNRDGSDDSRGWGTVAEAHLVGRAFFIWMSWDGERSRIDFDRVGMRIR